MPQPYDYGSLQPVLDPTRAVLEGALGGQQIQLNQQALQANQLQMQAQQAQAQRTAEFRQSFARLASNPNRRAEDYQELIGQFPEYAEQLTEGAKTMNAEQKESAFKDISGDYLAVRNGQPELAIKRLRDRAAAKRNAGQTDDADEDEYTAGLLEKSPNTATATLGTLLAANYPDKFGAVIDSLGLKAPTPTELQRNLSDPESAKYLKEKDAAEHADRQARLEESRSYHNDIAARAGAGTDASLDPETIDAMADQYLAGDKTVFQNLGRGAQGSANIVALRKAVAGKMKESGVSGADVAAKMAEFGGTMAAQRSLGTRIAATETAVVEAQKLIPIALEASRAVPRSSFLPFAKLEVAIKNGTNDPGLRKLNTANNALVNVYARAVTGGHPTVESREEGRKLLNSAYDQASYEAVVRQMEAEMQAARESPTTVRDEISDHASGRKPAAASSGRPVIPDDGPSVSNW